MTPSEEGLTRDVLAKNAREADFTLELASLHGSGHDDLPAGEDNFCLNGVGEAIVGNMGRHLDLESLEAARLPLLE